MELITNKGERISAETVDALSKAKAKGDSGQISLFGPKKQAIVATGKRGGKIYGYDSKGKPIYSKREAKEAEYAQTAKEDKEFRTAALSKEQRIKMANMVRDTIGDTLTGGKPSAIAGGLTSNTDGTMTSASKVSTEMVGKVQNKLGKQFKVGHIQSGIFAGHLKIEASAKAGKGKAKEVKEVKKESEGKLTPESLLAFLGEKPGRGTSVSELAYSFGIDSNRVTKMLTKMVKEGKLETTKAAPGMKRVSRTARYQLSEKKEAKVEEKVEPESIGTVRKLHQLTPGTKVKTKAGITYTKKEGAGFRDSGGQMYNASDLSREGAIIPKDAKQTDWAKKYEAKEAEAKKKEPKTAHERLQDWEKEVKGSALSTEQIDKTPIGGKIENPNLVAERLSESTWTVKWKDSGKERPIDHSRMTPTHDTISWRKVSETKKSLSGIDSLDNYLEKSELTPEKARKILHDKEVHGNPLTDQQRKYFGAVASGTAQKSDAESPEEEERKEAEKEKKLDPKPPPLPATKSCATPGEKIRSGGKGRGLAHGKGSGPMGNPVDKSMSGIDSLDDYLEKAIYIGPRGGRWLDPKHTIPYKTEKEKAKPQAKKEEPKKPKQKGGASRQLADRNVKKAKELLAMAKGEAGRAKEGKGTYKEVYVLLDKAAEKADMAQKQYKEAGMRNKALAAQKLQHRDILDLKSVWRQDLEDEHLGAKLAAKEKARDEPTLSIQDIPDMKNDLADHKRAVAALKKIRAGKRIPEVSTSDALHELHVVSQRIQTSISRELRGSTDKAYNKKLKELNKKIEGKATLANEADFQRMRVEKRAQSLLDGISELHRSHVKGKLAIDVVAGYAESGPSGASGDAAWGIKMTWDDMDAKLQKKIQKLDGEGVAHLIGYIAEQDKPAIEIPKLANEFLKSMEDTMSGIDSLEKFAKGDVEKKKVFTDTQDADALEKGVTDWAMQFYATPLYREALKCLRGDLACERKYAEHDASGKSYTETDKWPSNKREAYRAKRSKQRAVIDKESAEIASKKRALETQLVDFKLEEAKTIGKSEEAMSGIDKLADYSQEAKDEVIEKAQTIPEGNPKQKLAQGEEQGGKLDAVGKTSGSGESTSPGKKPKEPAKDKLSEDDKEDEKQMSEHKKPIETAKSMSLNPANQRGMVAQEHAAKVSQLQKGEDDITPEIPANPEKAESNSLEKSKTWNQGKDSLVSYSDKADLATEKLLKSDNFYSNESPTITRDSVLTQYKQCPACKEKMSKSLSACPNCGEGSVKHRVSPITPAIGEDGNEQFAKSRAPLLRPAKQEKDLHLPNGATIESE